MPLSEPNSFLLLQLLIWMKRAKRKKEGKPLCSRSQRTRTGVCTWSCWPGSWRHQSCRRNSSVPVLPPARIFSRARLRISLVPSHVGLCHSLVWELESTSDPAVCCTCDSFLTKEKRNLKRLSKLNYLQQLLELI